MPKTAKKGFTYFRFETDHFYDLKVKRLKNKFGMEGWGVFHFIVNEIYRVEGCYMVMDADGLFDISDYSRMDEKKVSDIIDYCAELGLFNKELWQDKQILTSEEIQELYVGICKAIHRKPGIPESILLLETEPSPESATIPHATCEQQDTPAHECGSPASLPEDGKEIRQAVTRIRTLFAAEKELQAVVFQGDDSCVEEILIAAKEIYQKHGCSKEFLYDWQLLIEEVKAYQKESPHTVHLPKLTVTETELMQEEMTRKGVI